MTESTGTTNPMQVGIRLTREIKVDDNVDGDDVDTAREDIRGDQATSLTSLKVVEDSVHISWLLVYKVKLGVEASLTCYGLSNPFLSE